VKQSVAANQQALRSYTWLEKTVLSIPPSKIEVRITKSNYQKLAM